jgi:hypothetical protein
MKIPTNTLLIGIAIVVVLGGLYLYFFSGSPQTPVSASAPAGAQEQQFLNAAAELQPISFNTAIFTDPRFASLVDITVPVSPDVQGRTDPFAPIPGLAAAPTH